MFISVRLKLIIITVILSLAGVIHPQVRITQTIQKLPPGFEGFDPAILVDNLTKAAVKANQNRKTSVVLEKAIRGTKIFGDLTVGDLFLFRPESYGYVRGHDARNNSLVYQAQLYRLVDNVEFPEPKVDESRCHGRFGRWGDPGLGKSVSSRYELVNEYGSTVSIDAIWRRSTLSLRTEPSGDKGVVYKGVPNQSCPGGVFVRTPQNHYELAFVKAQPFRLIDVFGKVFSLDTYENEEFRGLGIAAFLPDERIGKGLDNTLSDPEVLFLVKLVPPYVKSEPVSVMDTFEKAPNIAIRKKLYVDIVGIWHVDRSTGTILSKDLGQTVDLLSYKPPPPKHAAPYGPTRRLRLILKPRPDYTSEAKRNNTEGTVDLRVTFLASGQIGEIVAVKELPDGLTDQAIIAAKQMTFEPAKKLGVPYNVTRLITYGRF